MELKLLASSDALDTDFTAKLVDKPLQQHRRTVIATNTIYYSGEHPSHIVLPVVSKR
ncbi:MAG: Antibiotic hydrolase [Prosthecobacter sp.]|nr:Antibiotic hydrolase [Prosthecobacter sp.]